MTVTEALRILQAAPANAPEFLVTLACGFTPLHLETFLGAHLQQVLESRTVRIETGLFGDLAGTLESLAERPARAVAIALEWPDLDARLGYRQLGGWGLSEVTEIVTGVRKVLEHLLRSLEGIPQEARVALSLPTLPLPPAFSAPRWQSSGAELELANTMAAFARQGGSQANVFLVNSEALAEGSPLGGRFDLKSDLLTGLPYSLHHAATLGAALAAVLVPRAPKKGLITDLDDTLWRGIVGEDGPESVSWDLASHSQVHGLYQQVLRALADQGVLIGVASKNDPIEVQKVFARSDMLLPASKVFPIEANWKPKSVSVSRILRAWNIGAESILLLDDSPVELAEVKAAHPDIECIAFPNTDYAAAYALLRKLRDIFGTTTVSPEDRLRLESIRQGAKFHAAIDEVGPAAQEEFLANAGAAMDLDFRCTSGPRGLELVNKTNQFNLNGVRFTDADWRGQLQAPGAFQLTISYQDKFGPLGKIAVVRGRCESRILHIGTWVMSCRAFGRRIEHGSLDALFRRFCVDEIRFEFTETAKNGPLRRFLAEMLGCEPAMNCTLSRERFLKVCPPLHHQVTPLHE